MSFESLESLNLEIGQKETAIDDKYFEKLLAPAFAMRRANDAREIVDRDAFLENLRRARKNARETQIDTISLVGHERAVASCIVKMGNKRYHNLRVFVRSPNRQRGEEPAWLLLSWANEPLPD
jgi:hypothetical protein